MPKISSICKDWLWPYMFGKIDLTFRAISSGSGGTAWLEMMSFAFLRARCRASGFPFSK
jgi:hypothetical protein